MIFKTTRLEVKLLQDKDQALFYELMGNPNVTDPIPQKALSKEESNAKLKELIQLEQTSTTRIWRITKKGENDLIGICGVLKNEQEEEQIAYRLIERHWGNGYGTEIAKGLMDYCFEELNLLKITADVNIANIKSLKILVKIMNPLTKFFNEKDNCIVMRFGIDKEEWEEDCKLYPDK